MTCTVNSQDLAYFSGSAEFFRIPLSRFVGTDGCKYLMKNGAGWLVQDVAIICSSHPKVRSESFVAIKCVVRNGTAEVKYEDGDCKVLHTQKYDMTDLPVSVSFFATDGVLMLCSEY